MMIVTETTIRQEIGYISLVMLALVAFFAWIYAVVALWDSYTEYGGWRIVQALIVFCAPLVILAVWGLS